MSEKAPPRMYARPSKMILQNTSVNRAPEGRVEELAQRFSQGRDLWTGEELVGKDLDQWTAMRLEAIQYAKRPNRPKKRKETA